MMAHTLSEKLTADHFPVGKKNFGPGISLKMNSTTTQDATGTLVMPALEAMELGRDVTIEHSKLRNSFEKGDALCEGQLFRSN